ncbi:dephospho-CoA kinase [Candidatus Poriferisodalis sp.]|uniref:dephospho-CoA kinase n=1 Tax=Candidatus Poriferisodalis sp. TaxID=3101277 RepID=UPI003B01672F
MLIVGLTGGIGAGKSSVARLLAGHGAAVVDVDALGREIIAPGGSAVQAVLQRFGSELAGPDGGIDRPALASIVFNDPDKLAALNEISHPAINELLDEQIESIGAAGTANVVVLDMAVLVESTLGRDTRFPYEVVITVEAPPDVRLERLVERGMTPDDAKARLASQATDEQRREAANFVIGNGGGSAELAEATGELWDALRRLADERSA